MKGIIGKTSLSFVLSIACAMTTACPLTTWLGLQGDDTENGNAHTAMAALALSYAPGGGPDPAVTEGPAPGITVEPNTGLRTTEYGETATFTIVLDTQPQADVAIELTSSDETEGTVSPAALTLTGENWNTPQSVTVTGQDDAESDGDIVFSVITAPAESSDPAYGGINPADVSLTNADDDAPGVTVTPTSGLVTTEAGGQAQFKVVLNSRPAAEVTINVTSDDSNEGTAAPASLVFTAGDWNEQQTVTVTGANDDVQDGARPYNIETAAVSADPDYHGIAVEDVSVTNTDNDTAGITVSPTSLTTCESVGYACQTRTFTVVLNTRPTADVTIGISSNDASEGAVSHASLTFTDGNWSTARTVTVTGQDDSIVDGPQAYSVLTAPATSDDSNYGGMNAQDVGVTNTDNDSANLRIFVTASAYNGNLGGISGANDKCNTDANRPDPAKTYRVLIYPVDCCDNTKASTTYVRVDGSTVMGNTGADCCLNSPLANSPTTLAVSHWHGANFPVNETCSDWTSTGGSGDYGTSNSAGDEFWHAGTSNCDQTARLICAEQ